MTYTIMSYCCGHACLSFNEAGTANPPQGIIEDLVDGNAFPIAFTEVLIHDRYAREIARDLYSKKGWNVVKTLSPLGGGEARRYIEDVTQRALLP